VGNGGGAPDGKRNGWEEKTYLVNAESRRKGRGGLGGSRNRNVEKQNRGTARGSGTLQKVGS